MRVYRRATFRIPRPDTRIDRAIPTSLVRAAIGILLGALILAALVRPIDHDEGQYVAATLLARSLLPYRDFDYLQTPLQPLILAPLLAAWPRHALLLLRLTNAALIAGVVVLVYRAARAVGADRRKALTICALLSCCEPLLFAASVARNDALPCLFLSAAILTMTGRPTALGRAAIGLLLTAAAATKLSYAVPCAAIFLVEIFSCRDRTGLVGLAWMLAGALPPLVATCALAWLSFPQFWFDVVVFPVRAPAEWYGHIDTGWRLSPMARSLDFLKFLCLGPAAVVLLVVMAASLREHPAARRSGLAIRLDVLVAAGAVAALLPVPEWRQYLVPLLPPLFVRAAMIGQIDPLLTTRRGVLFVPFIVAGLFATMAGGWAAWNGGSPVLRVERDAGELGHALRNRGVTGPVATLSPERVADTELPVDPQFAAGPFLFRTRDGLGVGATLVGVTRASLVERFDRRPPAAIVVGGGHGIAARQLDALLIRWASGRGFVTAGPDISGMRILVPKP